MILNISRQNSAAMELLPVPTGCQISSMKIAFSFVRSSFALPQTKSRAKNTPTVGAVLEQLALTIVDILHQKTVRHLIDLNEEF
jgi:hypothetical protein